MWSPGGASADRGDPESRFGGDGTAFVPGTALTETAAGVVVQSDGRVVVVTTRQTSEGGDTSVVVTRFTANGRVDRSFGDAGQSVVRVDARDTTALAAAVQADDRIVIAGQRGQDEDRHMTVVRLDADGALDESFAGDGSRVIELGNSSWFEDVAVDADGRIVASGTIDVGVDATAIVVRLTSTGNRDASFGRRGLVRLPGTDTDIATARDLALASGGRYLVAVETMASGAGASTHLVRLRGGGAIDTRFGDDGRVDVSVDSLTRVLPVGLAVDAAGRALVLLHARADEGVATAHVAAFGPDGGADESFGGDGVAEVSRYVGGWVAEGLGALAVQSNGRLLVGLSEESDRSSDATIAALRPDGRPDRSFSSDGGVTLDYEWETNSDVRALALHGTRLYLSGGFVDEFVEGSAVGVAAVRLR